MLAKLSVQCLNAFPDKANELLGRIEISVQAIRVVELIESMHQMDGYGIASSSEINHSGPVTDLDCNLI